MSDEPTKKLEFGSDEWVAELERLLRAGFAEHPHPGPISVCEVYTDPPEHLRPADGSPFGWWFRVTDGVLEVGRGEIFDADRKHTVDYQSALPSARKVHGDDPEPIEVRQAWAAKLTAEGKLKSEIKPGLAQGEPPAFAVGLHDALARITA